MALSPDELDRLQRLESLLQLYSTTRATTGSDGLLSYPDKVKLDAAVGAVSGTYPIFSTGGTSPTISIAGATTSAAGSMSAVDKVLVNQLATATAWAAPTLATNWTDFSGTNAASGYMKDALGWINIDGMVKKSIALTAADTLFTLPAGFRPTKDHHFATIANGPVIAWIKVAASGVVTVEAGGSATWTSLSGVRFDPTR